MDGHPRSDKVNLLHGALVGRLGVAAIALLIGACQAPAATSPSTAPIAVGSAEPSNPTPSRPVASAGLAPSAPGTPAKPTPAPVPPKWSKSVTVKGLAGCHAVVLAVDDGGSQHLAATCGLTESEIRYAVSIDGASWTTTVLKPPADRFELDPQLAFSGDTLYLAYTRVAPEDGGCGGDGLADVGVWYRTRTLPSGDWSEPTQIGRATDHLDAFRVSGSDLHATVTNEKDGETAYERQSGSTLERYPIAGAGGTSLRIGDDGKGRVAYTSSKGIGYGMVEGGSFVGRTIKSSAYAGSPVLTLAPGNAAYLLWTEDFTDGGCLEPDPLPTFGTYFATNASGTWVSSRLTTLTGSKSMTIDPATGTIHVLVSAFDRVVHFRRPAAGGEWAKATIARVEVWSAVIRQDPRDGALVVAYVADPDQEESQPEIRVMVRR